MIQTVIQAFKDVFKSNVTPRVFFAPGRVNLIGEHTDYNGGHVLPCALKRGTYAAAVKRTDDKIRLYSCNFEDLGILENSVLKDDLVAESLWTDYPLGMLQTFKNAGLTFDSGFDICFIGNIPNGAGLSSSASVEMVTGVIFNNFFGFGLDQVEIVKLAQKAENQFVGVNCGIMDQFVIGLGKEHQAVLLDTGTLEYTYAQVNLDDYALLIANTNKKRGLAESKYNERFAECRGALGDLQQVVAIESLGDLTEEAFEQYASTIKDPVAKRRARHAVIENRRTLDACTALNEGRLKDFGLMMNASHESLKNDYEVSCKELDVLVDLSQQFEGVIGSRMTGAGFGGCTVTLIEKGQVDRFIKEVGAAYLAEIGYAADFYPVEIGDGAREVNLG